MGGKPRKKPTPMTSDEAFQQLGEALDDANAVVTLHGVPLNKKRTSIEQELHLLGKAVKGLSPDHKIVGRRNSRKAVLYRLKRLREVLDQEFPTITKKRKKPRGPRSGRQQIRDFEQLMSKRRYKVTSYNDHYLRILSGKVGFKVYRCPVTDQAWWPVWMEAACAMGESHEGMKRLCKNKKAQLAAEAQWRLEAGGPESDAESF